MEALAKILLNAYFLESAGYSTFKTNELTLYLNYVIYIVIARYTLIGFILMLPSKVIVVDAVKVYYRFIFL